jgi:hypothetical protein
MRNVILSLFLMAIFQAARADAAQEAVGEWSAENHFLQARLIASNKLSEIVLYLELRNTCPRAGTVLLNVAMDPATNITCRVVDENGVELKPEFPAFRDTIRIHFYNLALPPDGSLRFPISVAGGGDYQDKTKLDLCQPTGIWYFGPTNHGDYSLSGVLTIPRARGTGPQVWNGRLELPPVRLPFPQPGVHPTTAPDADARGR